MSNAAKSSVNISAAVFHADGSGAPTTVECAGYVFACDYLNGVRMTLIRPVSGSRRESEIAARRVESTYLTFITHNAPDGWLSLNAEMYAH
jgi:predicted glycosyltransferase